MSPAWLTPSQMVRAIRDLREAEAVLRRFERGLLAIQRRDRRLAKWFKVEAPARTRGATHTVFSLVATKRLRDRVAAVEALRGDGGGRHSPTVKSGRRKLKAGGAS